MLNVSPTRKTRPDVGACITSPVGQDDRFRSAAREMVVSPPQRDPAALAVNATFHISTELLDELREATVFLSGPPDRLTLSGLAEEALRREVERLNRVHTKGKNFAERTSELKGGRPIR